MFFFFPRVPNYTCLEGQEKSGVTVYPSDTTQPEELVPALRCRVIVRKRGDRENKIVEEMCVRTGSRVYGLGGLYCDHWHDQLNINHLQGALLRLASEIFSIFRGFEVADDAYSM